MHGGPGAGLIPDYRRFFDAILIESYFRSTGRRSEHATCLPGRKHYRHLVADIEQLRTELGSIVGWSWRLWGSTLSPAYAETHPNAFGFSSVASFLPQERDSLVLPDRDGGGAIFPDVWEQFLDLIPPGERADLVSAYHRRLTSDDETVRLEAARRWSIWEGSALRLLPDPSLVDQFSAPHLSLSLARIECHYFLNDCFFPSDNYLIENVDRIRQIPTVIVQGRYDIVCPMMSAWDLHRAWPEAEFRIIPDAGHSVSEPGIASALVEATDRFPRFTPNPGRFWGSAALQAVGSLLSLAATLSSFSQNVPFGCGHSAHYPPVLANVFDTLRYARAISASQYDRTRACS